MRIKIGGKEVSPDDLMDIKIEVEPNGEILRAIHIHVSGGQLRVVPDGNAAAITISYWGSASPGIAVGVGENERIIIPPLNIESYQL